MAGSARRESLPRRSGRDLGKRAAAAATPRPESAQRGHTESNVAGDTTHQRSISPEPATSRPFHGDTASAARTDARTATAQPLWHPRALPAGIRTYREIGRAHV